MIGYENKKKISISSKTAWGLINKVLFDGIKDISILPNRTNKKIKGKPDLRTHL